MKKIVFDSDGLIKLVKSGIFNKIAEECFISEEVYLETVTAGKKGFHDDAHLIEQYIKEKKIIVKKAQRTEEKYGLGKGEASALALFKIINADVIISDDRKFLALLEEENVPFIIPTEAIVALAYIVKAPNIRTKKSAFTIQLRRYKCSKINRLSYSKHIKKSEGREALNKIKNLVRKENYESALFALGGEK